MTEKHFICADCDPVFCERQCKVIECRHNDSFEGCCIEMGGVVWWEVVRNDTQDKIYIITSGTYSDYKILGVTLNKEHANVFAKKWDGRIEEYTLSTSEEFEYIKDKQWFTVQMSKDGSSEVMNIDEPDTDLKTKYDFYTYKDGHTALEVRTWANSEEHAVKIANEIRIQVLASGEWERFDIEKVGEKE